MQLNLSQSKCTNDADVNTFGIPKAVENDCVLTSDGTTLNNNSDKTHLRYNENQVPIMNQQNINLNTADTKRKLNFTSMRNENLQENVHTKNSFGKFTGSKSTTSIFDQTYAVDQPDILESTYLVDNDFEEKQPLTPVKSNIPLKSHIPRRTPLKGKHGEKRRVVSHSDDETARPSQSSLNRTFDVRSKKQFKTRRNVGLPTRAKSSIDLTKENTRPTTAASYKRRLLKSSQSTLCLRQDQTNGLR